MTDKPSDGVPTDWEPDSVLGHWMVCPTCGERFDMRKLENVGKHLHDASNVEMVETFGPPTRAK